MPKWTVSIRDSVDYEHVEAKTVEEATEIALEWFNERWPDIYVEEEEDEEDFQSSFFYAKCLLTKRMKVWYNRDIYLDFGGPLRAELARNPDRNTICKIFAQYSIWPSRAQSPEIHIAPFLQSIDKTDRFSSIFL